MLMNFKLRKNENEMKYKLTATVQLKTLPVSTSCCLNWIGVLSSEKTMPNRALKATKCK